MAFSGFKKTFIRANQRLSEKMGAAEKTKLTDEYCQMEKLTEVTVSLVDDLISRTKEYLQPNPGNRSKLAVGQKTPPGKGRPYNQPEGILGDSMAKYGQKYGDSTAFGNSLIEMGEALKQLAEVKFELEDNVRQNFLEPLHLLQTKDIREVQRNKKKLESRRLDFDMQRRRKESKKPVSEEELRNAEEKFTKTFNITAQSMHNLLQNGPEHVAQLAALSEAIYEYHQQCASIMGSISSRLKEMSEKASSEPQKPYVPKYLAELRASGFHTVDSSDKSSTLSLNSNGSQNGSSNGQKSMQNNRRDDWVCLDDTQPAWNSNSGDNYKFNSKSSTPTPASIFFDDFNDNSNAYTSRHTTVSAFRAPSTKETNVGNMLLMPPQQVMRPNRPFCKALYDFDAENSNELTFKEGDIIYLNSKLDDNWYNGTCNGKSGIFPINYVDVVVPLSQN